MVARGSVIIVVMTFLAVGAVAITEPDWPLVAGTLIAALAFGLTLIRKAPRSVRVVAFGLQVLAMVGAVTLVGLVARTTQSNIPWSFWLGALVALCLGLTATAEGYRVYRRS